MAEFIVRRLHVSIIVVWGSLTLVFLILNVLPGDPAELILGQTATEEMIAKLHNSLGLGDSTWQQYVTYMSHIVHGNFGVSYVTKQPVLAHLIEQFPATLSLTVASVIIAIGLGLILGILSAVYPNRMMDYVIRFVTLFSISMPTFWIGILLILIFSVSLHWLPAIGNGSWQQLILPASCLGIACSGSLARMVRNSMLEVIHEQYVTTLRSKGLTERNVIYRHVLRNALIPTITMVGILVGELLSGSVVTETVFSRQGVGKVVVDAIMQKDIPVVQAAIMFASIFYVLVNLCVDITYTVIDPRIRSGSKSALR
ncbi:peptide ABC transporter permease [Paenibacillus pectinilyticus]|uniref:Peptide ABC transporter permease n=1 Tax=Paenibacillus pectinilyticus TaxID=512399 RepID=A0A1C1A0Q7_9BACL|nr:ABC transporter permease [Paenibacillus pectinilyticus]OCT13982.1 peptide ABC transporter permease [Paenibacillus pectinilyticus]